MSRDYAIRRKSFKKLLIDHASHRQILSHMEVSQLTIGHVTVNN